MKRGRWRVNSYYCTKCRHEINNTKVPANKTCIHCGGEMHIKQEKEMQKFEIDQKGLEADIGVGNVCDWVDARYIGIDKAKQKHAVWAEGTVYFVCDSEIRPVQLICDEAREKIEFFLSEADGFKVRLENHDMLPELSKVAGRSYTKTMVSNLLFFNSNRSKEISHCSDDVDYFDRSVLPELNLKTGVIVPCEEPEKKIENCCHCYEMSKGVESKNFEITKLKGELKEYKSHYDCHMRKISNREEHLDSALSELKEKDEAMELAHIAMKEAESCITELKEGNKDLCEKLHAKDTTVKKFAAMIDELELAVTEKDVTIANLKELDFFKVAELMKSERDAISIELLEAHETINGFFEHWVSIQKQTESYLYDVKKTTKGE